MNHTTARVWLSMIAGLLLLGSAGCETPRDHSFAQQIQEVDFQGAAARPPTPKTLLAMARILAAQGKDEEARFVFGRLLSEYPEFMPGYVELAEVHMRADRVEDARQVLLAGLQFRPDDPVLLNDIGMTNLVQAEYDLALVQFRRAAALDPCNTRYRANVAAALGLMGRYDESLNIYMQIMPQDEAFHNVGVLAEARDDCQCAAAHFALARQAGFRRECD